MPLIRIETNQTLGDQAVLEDISQATASLLGKPESYVMVTYHHNANMLFAGDSTPLAYVQLKSLGLPEDKTASFSQAICDMMQTHFEVSPERVYIEFSSPARHFWGWNNGTF